MGVFHSKLAQGLPLLLAGFVAACGARSGLDCFGESCQRELEGASEDQTGVDPDSEPGSGGRGPAAGGQGSVAPPPGEPSPPTVGPDDPPPVSISEPTCFFDSRFGPSIVVQTPADLELLEGCREVEGDLLIQGLFTDDLRELRELRRVGGSLQLLMSGSLEGLENLEAVGNLLLESLDAPTLAPLRNLRQIGTNLIDDGALLISNLLRVRDLAGLGGIESVRDVLIDNAGTLTSLAGLELPAKLGQVQLSNSPVLLDLSALSSVQEVDWLVLIGMNNSSLSGLENLRVAGDVTLIDLPELTDLRPLASLRVIGSLTLSTLELTDLAGLEGLARADLISIGDIPSLVEVDALQALVSLNALVINQNPALLRLPEFRVDVVDSVYVGENERLEVGPRFPLATRIEELRVFANPALVSLGGFSGLQLAGNIDIRDNAALSELDLGQLQALEFLQISCNAALPESTLEPLRSLGENVTIYGNLGSATPCESTP
jgi:hypothetical protein